MKAEEIETADKAPQAEAATAPDKAQAIPKEAETAPSTPAPEPRREVGGGDDESAADIRRALENGKNSAWSSARSACCST